MKLDAWKAYAMDKGLLATQVTDLENALTDKELWRKSETLNWNAF